LISFFRAWCWSWRASRWVRSRWTAHANAGRHSALSYEHAGKIEAQLKAEVAELLARAEAGDQADVPDGMSIPDQLASREERLAKLAAARAKIEARAEERYEREKAEHEAKLATRKAKAKATGKKPGGKSPHGLIARLPQLTRPARGQLEAHMVLLGAATALSWSHRH
jgi:hypothetical protein